MRAHQALARSLCTRAAHALPADGVLNDAYEVKALSVITERLAKVTARLARLVNEALRAR